MSHLFSTDSVLYTAIATLSAFLWSHFLITLLLGCGLYFTCRLRFAQFRMVGEMVRLLSESILPRQGEKQISSFQAFAVSVATRVGTGNLAGVATAIAIGGPGAVFWMWVTSLVGSASAFVEATLAQLYKQRSSDSFVGGPAYYMLHGLHCRWMSVLFAVLITLTFGLSYNSIQANTICEAWHEAFAIPPFATGIMLAVMGVVIVFGGIQRIAKVSSVLVPIMAFGFFFLSLTVVVMNIGMFPRMLQLIVENAFGFEQAVGGSVGAAMMAGIKRGLFSNEAGEGSSPNVAATATTSHPAKQGLIQALGVFTDTLLLCSCTAFIILLSGIYQDPALNGIVLTQNALSSQVGPIGVHFVAIAIFLFAFSSIIGNYYYGEANIRFLTSSKWVLGIYRVLSAGVFVLFGSVATLDFVWNIGDLFMALVTACNLAAILLLGKHAFRLLNDYCQQKKEGKDPHFCKRQMPDIEKDIACWES